MISIETIKQFIVYNLIGIVNTLVGFSLVFFFLFVGMSPMVSNFIGYLLGVILSFFLNKRFTFIKYKIDNFVIIAFFSILFFAYLVNAVIFYVGINSFNLSPYVAQIISGVVYTLLSFTLMKTLVFVPSREK